MSAPAILKFGTALLENDAGWRAAAAAAVDSLAHGGVVVVATPGAWRSAALEALAAAGNGDGAAALAGARRITEGLECHARDLGLEAAAGPASAPLLQRLSELIQGACLVGHASPRTRDAVLGLLGALSASLFAALLASRGLPARVAAALPDARGDHGRARPRAEIPWADRPAGREALVLPGGFGHGEDGAVLAYGPGGPDLSAVALAAGWGSPGVLIWTGDDGIQSADPSLVPGAKALPRLSYAEAQALSGFGARALHPEVLAIAARAGLELVLANLHAPERRTLISGARPARLPGSVASVAYKEGLHLLRLPAAASLDGLAAADAELRAAGAQRYGAIAGPEGMLLVLRAEGAEAVARLAAFTDAGAELSGGWALVALVGEGLRATPGSALRLLAPFQLETVGGLLAGSSPISVSFLVPEERLPDLVPRLHHLWIGATERTPILTF